MSSKNINRNYFRNLFLFNLFLFTIFVFGQSGNENTSKANTESISLQLNRISLPVYERGMIAREMSRNYQPEYGGYIDSKRFMLSSGFLLSGINDKGDLWTNGVEPGLDINDYVKGTVTNPGVSKSIFYNSKEVEPFSQLWLLWKDAVKMGAEFYDGDGDGIYDPIDKNQNGKWDENEDRPPQYGDIMCWSVFNDGMEINNRKIKNVKPQGIEIRQTLWAYRNDPELETTFFIKYSLLNTGTVAAVHDSVYFTVYSDSYLGWVENELMGSNQKDNSVFMYFENGTRDNTKPISYLVSMLQGPNVPSHMYLAYNLVGENLDDIYVEKARTLSASSAQYISYGETFNDPISIRNRMLGNHNPDPCNDQMSIVTGFDCSNIDSKFIYSGDPLIGNGWLNTQEFEKKLMLSTGPFILEQDKPIDIIFSYTVGEGNNGLEAYEDVIRRKNYIDYYFYTPPKSLPIVEPIIITADNYIELVWETSDFYRYSSEGYGYQMRFEGFNIYMFRTNSTVDEVNGIKNKIKIMSYDTYNTIDKILVIDPIEYDTDVVYEGGQQLSWEYSGGDRGRIKLKIQRDPFDYSILKKGKPYYISINPFALNYENLQSHDNKGAIIIPRIYDYGYEETESIILTDDKGNPGIVIGENENDPYFKGIELEHTNGNSEVKLTYSVYDKEKLTGDIYEVGFYRNQNELYELNYYLKNLNNDEFLINDLPIGYYKNDVRYLTDGFLLYINWLEPGIKSVKFEGEQQWYEDFNYLETGVFYLGIDAEQQEIITPVSPRKYSTAITVDKLADVELHFGNMSKAYRYLRRAVRYMWAGHENPEEGWVDIPVEAYKKNIDGSKTKLSVGFIENAFVFDSLAHPDLIWNPGSDLEQSKEYLIVFNAEYSEDYKTHIAYTGNDVSVANISLGYLLNTDNDSLRSVAKSPWFDAMYIIGFKTEQYDVNFSPTGKLIIEANKVLSVVDKYLLNVKNEKTNEELKEQFDKINVVPNPFFADNPLSSEFGGVNEPFITFTHLPTESSIKIYTLAGILVKSIKKDNLSSMYRWNLENDSGIRVASGMFIAVVESPNLGQKILKFAIIMPQKQVHY